jgi:hypothetical protein
LILSALNYDISHGPTIPLQNAEDEL